tara:strand:- start:42 stop:1643 length:1602 start_codon:yes stop_codon:yes gene_type:complete
MKKITAEFELKTGKTKDDLGDIQDGLKGVEKGLDAAGKEGKKTNKILKGISNLFKGALGLGIVIKLFDVLKDTFMQNQKVADGFATVMEALSLAFNDLFKFLDSNIGNVVGYFKAIFSDPKQAIVDFGVAIKENLIERFNSALEVLGFLGTAIKKVFEGDFDGAMEAAKNAGKEYVDVLTGVDNSVDKIVEGTKEITSSIIKYGKSTIDAAADIVKLNKAAELASVINQGLIEKYDRQAEIQRQIRDDETKPMQERIAANTELGRILDEQSKKMLENAAAIEKAAQAQFNKNDSDENNIALQEAKNEVAAIEAQIEGFRSEQLINRISLEREAADLKTEAEEKEIERKEKLIELEQQRKQGIFDAMDAVAMAAGEESKIAKALFLLKTGMILKEQILKAQATMQSIIASAAESGVDGAKGFMKAAAAAPPPANVPLIALFAIQAAGIAMSIKSAVSTAKSMVGSKGGSGSSGGGSISAPQAPSFNVVGAAPENQLAQAIGEQEEKPIKAFVVSNEVTNAQALERNIVEGASIG